MESILLKWIDAGFSQHEAIKWHFRGFTLEEAILWKMHGFEVVDACCFKNDRISPLEAKEMIIQEVKEAL